MILERSCLMPDVVWIWLAAFAIFLILEVMTPSMLFIGFSISALISGMFSFFYPESFYWQIGIFIIVSAIILPLTRKMAKKMTKDSPQIANVDALIGKVGLVTKPIDPDLGGQISINGEIWRAAATETILENEKAKILKVVGATVHVEKQ